MPGTVVMPVTTPQQKIDKTRVFGREFITIKLVGDTFDQSYAAARQLEADEAAIMIPPFDHPRIIEGQATVGAEILDARIGPIDLVMLPVGGGGLSRRQLAGSAFDAPRGDCRGRRIEPRRVEERRAPTIAASAADGTNHHVATVTAASATRSALRGRSELPGFPCAPSHLCLFLASCVSLGSAEPLVPHARVPWQWVRAARTGRVSFAAMAGPCRTAAPQAKRKSTS